MAYARGDESSIMIRRKLFFIAVITIFALAASYYSGIRLLAEYPEKLMGRAAVYEGRVEAIEKSEGKRISLKVRVLSADGEEIKGNNCILLTCYNNSEDPWLFWNSKIIFSCTAENAEGARNPGCFDYRRHLLSKGIKAAAVTDGIAIEKEKTSAASEWQRYLIKAKYSFAEALSAESRGIVMGMTFGDTSFLEEELYEDFRVNGTAHVLAVSGLHVGILYRWIKKALGKKSTSFSLAAVSAILLIYCFLSSFSVSAARASAMIVISAFAEYCDRRYDMLTSAGAIALLLMAENPYIIFSAGFQMSFLAVCSISFLYRRLPDKIPKGIAVMLSVNIGLLPYQAYVFNWISLSSLAANIPVVYLTSVTVPMVILSFITFLITGDAGLLGEVTEILSQIILKLNALFAFDGKGGTDVLSPPLWLIILTYFLLFFITSETFELLLLRKKRRKIAAVICALVIAALCFNFLSYQPVRDCELIFVDVGQGDCVHVKSEGRNVLIDGGGRAEYNTGKKTVKPYLLKNGVKYVDLAIATHMHTDHFKGLSELAEEGMTGSIKTGLTAGKTFNITAGLKIETLWPVSLKNDVQQEQNKNCSVFMIYLKGYKILVTGDLDGEGEREMVAYYKNSRKLKADILKVGHHGSKTSTTDLLLEAVEPKYAVIQVGKNNYGHPHIKIIEKCDKKGIMVLRNDTHGAVGFSFSKDKYSCCTMIEED